MRLTTILLVLILSITAVVDASQLERLREGVAEISRLGAAEGVLIPPEPFLLEPPLPHAPGPGAVLDRLLKTDWSAVPFYRPDDMIIQDTVVINSDTTIYGNIVLLESGQLIVQNCAFGLKGDLTALQNSRFLVDSASFTVLQDFIYQHMLVAGDSASIDIRNSTFSSSLFPAACASAGHGSVVLDSVDMQDGFLTFAIMEGGSMDVSYSDRAGEFVVLGDSASLVVDHSDTVLVWLGFPEGSSGEVRGSPGMDDWVEHFVFPDSTCSGIGYSIQVDSLYALILATMAYDSTDVAVYDANLQSAGNIFWSTFSDTISGLVNGTLYSDWTAPFPGRNLRLVNTSIRAWNLYFSNNIDVTLKSSIFGEGFASDSSRVTIMNAVCDGAGGHIETNGSGFLLSFLSSFFTDALLQGRSTSLFFVVNFVSGRIIARDLAAAIAYNTLMVNPVQVYDSATVMIAGLYPPSPAYIEDTLSIQGSARMVKAAYSPFQFDGYRLEYAPREDTTNYLPLTGRIPDQVDDDELCEFITVGLDVGSYLIRMWYFLSAYTSSDSLPFTNSIYLTYRTGLRELRESHELALQVLPNCIGSSADIQYSIPTQSRVDLSIYDTSGRKVAVLDKSTREAGRYSAAWNADIHPGGVYFARLTCGPEVITTKLAVFDY